MTKKRTAKKKQKEPRKGSARRLMLLLLHHRQGWREQGEFAQAAGFWPSQVSMWQRGERDLPREELGQAAERTGFPGFLVEPALRALRSFLAAGAGRSRAGRVVHDVAAAELLALTREGIDIVLDPRGAAAEARPAGPPRAEDREEAAALWAHLEPLSPKLRRLVVEEGEEYWAWALCEKVAAESIAAAGNTPGEALELARLALLIAERVPGEQTWRWRLEGYALAPVANGLRATSDLPAAGETFARARKLWEKGAPGDPGLLDEAIFLRLEASLRRAQRRFPEALQLVDDALAVADGAVRARLLYTKARVLEALDDLEGSIAILQEAAPLIDEAQEPRLALGVRFQLLHTLCLQDRAAEAAPGLGEVSLLAERLGGTLDRTRCEWLRGKVAAGLGRKDEAQAAFEQVRREFAKPETAYDCALVSMDLALVLLEEGRTGAVRTLAVEMLQTFKALGIHREALAALDLFCQAARQETATAELARRVARFLYRAQHDPELRFEADEEAGAS
jgi:tetratricopeptide (TPR) repeat protein